MLARDAAGCAHALGAVAPGRAGRRRAPDWPGTSCRRSSRCSPACSSGASAGASRRAAAIVVITDGLPRRAREVGHGRQGHGHPQLGAAGRDLPAGARQRLGGDARPGRRADPALLRDARAQARPGAARRRWPPKCARRALRSGSSWSTKVPPSPSCGRRPHASSVPLTLLPFQPYADLPDVLGSGDILVVLLEQDAGEFSVPSKTLSYLAPVDPCWG